MSFLFFLPGLEYATRTQLHTEKVSCWQLALWASAWSQSSEYEVPKPYFRNRSSYSETRPCVRHWEPKSPGTHDDKHQLSYFPPWGILLPKKISQHNAEHQEALSKASLEGSTPQVWAPEVAKKKTASFGIHQSSLFSISQPFLKY